jgi:hypothetical protein
MVDADDDGGSNTGGRPAVVLSFLEISLAGTARA